MNQLTIFDFVEDVQIADISILNRIQSAFPGWEVLGYMKDWEWGTSDDYAAIIRYEGIYKWVRVELCHDGRSRAGYTERTDFEEYWFDLYEKKGKHWVWRSLDDRNRVFEIARQNAR
jgi:hypothetical protein